MQCPSCQHENPADTAFCDECGTRLEATCPSCGEANRLGAKFCRKCGHRVTEAAVTGILAGPRFRAPDRYTPRDLAEKILTSRSALEGERKQVTVLFADLKGSMELLADRDPEEARKLLDPVLEQMLEAVHHYEGTVNQVMGDGIMALFGAPVAHEDHAVRACYAALRMQESVRRYAREIQRAQGIPVQIRVGLHSGEVVVRSIGSDLRMDYTAVGQTTHLAARMEQMAMPGSILLTAETLGLAEGYVQVKPLGPVPVKGLETPIDVFEILHAGPTRSRLQAAAARGLTRFVGRETELEQLRQALEQARAGHGQVVALVGEPGVGKSRLFWEFVHSHRTAGWLILESGSVSYGKATAYLPVLDLLKGYFKIESADETRNIQEKVTGKVLTLDRTLEETIPAVLGLLDALPEESPFRVLDPPQRRQRTLDAIKRLLLRESQVQPLCLVFEDLHWIDAETQAVLESLVESLPTARLLLLVNYRPEYQHGWGSKTYYTQLRIDPLPPESADAFLHALLGDSPGLQPLKPLLIERTEGNPFFLEESVRTLVETHVLVGEPGGYRLARELPAIQVPATVQAMLGARIDRLSPEDKALLQSAAVVGKDVPFPVLQAIAELPEEDLRRRLTHLRAAEFLYETSLFPELEYTFKHALTHEVAYGGLLHERRKGLHAKVMAAIERLSTDRLAEQADALARHALRGEVWEKAVDYLGMAGAKAYERAAFPESLARYEQALELVARLPKSPENLGRAIDVRFGLHGPLFVLGEVPRLIQLYQEAEQFACDLGDQYRLARICSLMSTYAWMGARYAQGIEFAQRSLRIAMALDDPQLRIYATYTLGHHHLTRGDYRLAIDLFMRIVEGPDAELAKRLLGMTAPAYMAGCGWLAYGLAMLGDFERALMYADRGVQAADAFDHPLAQAVTYAFRASPLIYRGEFARALSSLERAIQLSETKGLRAWLPTAYSMWGHVLALTGRADEGLPYLERGATLHEGLGIKTHLSAHFLRWAEGLLAAGNIPEARRAADKALELATAFGERGFEAQALHVLGAIAAAGAALDPDSALSAYERALALAEELGMRPLVAHCHLGLGKLYLRTGDHTKAEGHVATATTMYREMGMGFWLAQTEAALESSAW